MSTLDQVLEEAMTLPVEQQEMLIQIIKSRMVEQRRQEIALDAEVSFAEFQAGKLKIQTATEAIEELRECFNHSSLTDV
ncbi:MAG: hypothetical protein F6J98_28300 [Moorea sp. SIO4G2]|uniref:hypothetical protein n=1 Tax=unclassified Moorena TaxID=2683338 RepID=UPI0013CD337B|nr:MULTISPECIES: hypothetical protein [unclassified Moorena]NEO64106.1 hypothetical protein [Moorena sp. SIO4G2]NEO16557.1 hypothetical protein [Moorena sp. SIO3E8]NEO25264.1 hypothetical protein [Moorena sp. SIO4A5]NEQ03087.1 hypothetical protein [Moorena sp. SIO3F7]NEQ63332.1 hypothetical protein [Moorena sp. SIO4A1]